MRTGVILFGIRIRIANWRKESNVPERNSNSEQPPIVSASEIGVDPEALWQTADKLRGAVDAAEYKHVVLGLIFLKYISDAFESRRAKLAEELEAESIKGKQAEKLLESRDEYTAKASNPLFSCEWWVVSCEADKGEARIQNSGVRRKKSCQTLSSIFRLRSLCFLLFLYSESALINVNLCLYIFFFATFAVFCSIYFFVFS